MKKLFKSMMVVVIFMGSQICMAKTEIDFSQTQCFAVSNDTIQINKIVVSTTNSSTISTVQYNVPFKFDLEKLILIPNLLDAVPVQEKVADTVLVKGRFYTVDEENSWAEAIAIEDGTIVYVGSMKGINSYVGKKTEVIDLEGKFALPSFVDSHLHPLSNSYAYLFQAALFNLSSTDEYVKAIKAFAEKHPDMEGIMGAGFERSLYDAVGPRKELLDAIDSERPIGIISRDIHSMWVNSKVLEMLGITKDTPNPEGGVIARDPKTGEPSGLLQEDAAMQLAWALFPQPSKKDYKTSLLWMQDWLNREGITTAHDAWTEFNPNYYKAFDELAKEGKLTVRYRGSWYIVRFL